MKSSCIHGAKPAKQLFKLIFSCSTASLTKQSAIDTVLVPSIPKRGTPRAKLFLTRRYSPWAPGLGRVFHYFFSSRILSDRGSHEESRDCLTDNRSPFDWIAAYLTVGALEELLEVYLRQAGTKHPGNTIATHTRSTLHRPYSHATSVTHP